MLESYASKVLDGVALAELGFITPEGVYLCQCWRKDDDAQRLSDGQRQKSELALHKSV